MMPPPALPKLNVVLVEPEIPPNTGNVARLCAATQSRLHLIEPLGFRLEDRETRRAGLDYWKHLHWQRWASWQTFQDQLPNRACVWFIESGGPIRYSDARYSSGDYLVFGRETAGLPRPWLEAMPEHWLRIPMFHPAVRSLNLANCVALVLFEALRQLEFPGEREGRL